MWTLTGLGRSEWLILELREIARKPWATLESLPDCDVQSTKEFYVGMLRPRV
jgi:hypothetical protein